MAMVQIDWRPDGPALRSFGRTVIIGSLLIAAVLWWGKGWRLAAQILAVVGVVIGGLGLTGSRVAMPGYWLWMGIAFVMGNIVSRIVLGIVYYLVLFPISLIMRVVGRDRLVLRRPDRATHWVDVDAERTVDDPQRQF